jgi:DNA-binding NarL/FixJ family response regulator
VQYEVGALGNLLSYKHDSNELNLLFNDFTLYLSCCIGHDKLILQQGAYSLTSRPIRVLIIDDNEVVRMGLEVFLETRDDMELIGEADNGETGVELCQQLTPDVVIVDFMMPGMDGIATVRRLRELSTPVRVMMLSAFVDEAVVQNVTAVNINGYILKENSIDFIAEAIRRIHQGERVFCSRVSSYMKKG